MAGDRPGCRATKHDTLNAATRTRGQAGGIMCSCPRGLELRELYLNERRNRVVDPPVSAGLQAARDVQPRTGERRPVRVPDLSGAPCTTPAGAELLDEATDGRGSKAGKYREAFVRLCLTECQVYADCLAWVTAGEGDHPGVWGKIWAGLTINDRKRLARERAGKQGWDEADKQRGTTAAQGTRAL